MIKSRENSWLHDVYSKMAQLNPEVKDIYESKIIEPRMNERISFYAQRLNPARNLNEDVMKRFYNIESNHCRPMMVERITINRIIQKHGDNGLINISACRSNNTPEENEENTRNLIQDLRRSPFTFLPGYGGYHDRSGDEQASFEASFNVFNYDKNGKPLNWEDLYNFAIELCGKYDQYSVLVKAPGKDPIYVDRNGEKANDRESGEVFKNDPNQIFFTSLKSPDEIDADNEEWFKQEYTRQCKRNGIKKIDFNSEEFKQFKKDHIKDTPVSRRYTYDIGFDECYTNPSPCTLTERQKRIGYGEILIDTQNV